jgi:hypothetical protein
MKTHLTLACLLTALSTLVSAQYDTLWIGTPDGPSTSLANTPFPTEPGRAARTQYLIRSSDLEMAGLNSEIVGICLQVVDRDLTDPACLVDVHVRMKNTVSSAMTDFEITGLQHDADLADINLSEGILGIPFNLSYTQWLGAGMNLLVEINYERNDAVGISPRIMLDTGLTYMATFTGHTGQAVQGQEITSGYPSDVITESDNSLPYFGLLINSTNAINDAEGQLIPGLWPNPASQAMNVRLPINTDRVRITDAMGRIVLDQAANAASKTVAIQDLPTGCYLLQAMSFGRVLVSDKFIKD